MGGSYSNTPNYEETYRTNLSWGGTDTQVSSNRFLNNQITHLMGSPVAQGTSSPRENEFERNIKSMADMTAEIEADCVIRHFLSNNAPDSSTSLGSDDTIYSYNEPPTHHFIKEEPNDADSDETPYSSDKEPDPEVNPNNHSIATSQLAHINAQLEEIRGELRVVQKELYEVHYAIANTRALVKMVEHHVKPKPKPYVPMQDPPAEA
ncbi:uncharacterized protein G2W53_035183 [Senna tora]|uniref:Uncharacterized protein n=1 Tax=Senna tora TaxID=362788 RepID=A0A834ST44_9FABA|nr:uncharacterized protein G2W53_035183 [Senna tora]